MQPQIPMELLNHVCGTTPKQLQPPTVSETPRRKSVEISCKQEAFSPAKWKALHGFILFYPVNCFKMEGFAQSGDLMKFNRWFYNFLPPKAHGFPQTRLWEYIRIQPLGFDQNCIATSHGGTFRAPPKEVLRSYGGRQMTCLDPSSRHRETSSFWRRWGNWSRWPLAQFHGKSPFFIANCYCNHL